MPKLKTCKSAAKRFSVTASGKVKHKRKNMGHIMTKKSSKRKRKLGKVGILSDAEARRAKTLLPYA